MVITYLGGWIQDALLKMVILEDTFISKHSIFEADCIKEAHALCDVIFQTPSWDVLQDDVIKAWASLNCMWSLHTFTRSDAFNFCDDPSLSTIHLTHLFNKGSPFDFICRKCIDSNISNTFSSRIVIDPVYRYCSIWLKDRALMPWRAISFLSLKIT